MAKYTYLQRQQVRQLVLEADIQRFSTNESLAYIKGKTTTYAMPGGIEISPEYFFQVKRNIHHAVEGRLEHFRKHRTAFIEEFFKRVDEVNKYQQELWAIFHKNPHNSTLQKDCIKELHQLTVTLTNLYDALPAFSTTASYAYVPNIISKSKKDVESAEAGAGSSTGGADTEIPV